MNNPIINEMNRNIINQTTMKTIMNASENSTVEPWMWTVLWVSIGVIILAAVVSIVLVNYLGEIEDFFYRIKNNRKK